MDKILVIGASGLLGFKAMEIGSRSYEMFGTYNTHKLEGKNMFKLDASDREEVNKLVGKIKPNMIFDAHTLPGLDYCELHMEEAWEINVTGTKNIAEAAKTVEAKYTYISTDNVFDGSKPEYTEEDTPNPLNYYAKTKIVGELMLEPLDIDYLILRPAMIYGLGGIGKVQFAVWLVEQLKKKQQVEVLTDQSNNPTFADNLVEVAYKLFEDDANGIFNASGSECLSRYEYSIRIAKIFNLDDKYLTPVTTSELKQVAARPKKLNMNVSKVERATGMKMLRVEEGLPILKRQMESLAKED